jgi:tetratricopeptide (TPR) repeat protein
MKTRKTSLSFKAWSRGGRSCTVWAGIAAFILLLVVSAPGENLLLTNLRNLALIRSLCRETDCATSVGGLWALHSEVGGAWRHGAGLDACQALWLSRLYSAESPVKAVAALETAKACPRRNLVNAWGGDLAWAQGDQDLAYDFWSQLPATSLSSGGYWLILQEEVQRGRTLLEIVERRYGFDLTFSQRLELYTRLGHSHRVEGKWAEAIRYYNLALDVDPMDTESRFYLGMCYRQNHQPHRALDVLEAGLGHLPPSRPGFASTYLVQLGLAYGEVGQGELAFETFRSAQEWLAEEKPPWPDLQRFIEEQMDALASQLDQP